MKTSSTQARQIHHSRIVVDSGGKGERSRGWVLLPALGFATAGGFRPVGFFFGAGFAAFGRLVEGVKRRADFLEGLDAGFIFRVGKVQEDT